MIIADAKKDVAVSSSFKTTGFSIQANAKAFEILSSNIYQNKVRAVIREISCNAYDAHIAAKNPEPFRVHLPTHLEPHFSVRDFGIGLDDESIREIFTVYFASTKTQSNDFIGALGLGSKSPFCLVDSFVVNSWKDGKKHSYSCYKDENGEPQIALLFTEDSDEPNGLEVSLNVEKSLIQEFKDEAKVVFETFDQLPIINIDEVVKHIQDIKYDLECAGKYKLKYARYENVCAVMGNVAYEIDTKYSDIFSGFVGYIYFDIGELSFNPGRENLSYDKKTIDALTRKLNQLAKEISQEVLDVFKGETNKFLRFKLASKHTLPLFKMDKELEEARKLQCQSQYTVYAPDYGGRRVSTNSAWNARHDVEYYKYQRGYEKRIKSFVKTNKVKIAVVNDEQIKELDIPSHLLGDLTTLPKVAYTRSSNGTVSYKPDTNAYKINTQYFNIVDVPTTNFNSQKLYVEFYGSGKSIVNAPSWCNTLYKICYIIKYLNHIGINIEVHAIRSGAVNAKNFNKDGSWTRFADFVQNKLDKHVYKQYKLTYEDESRLDTLRDIYKGTGDERLKFIDEIYAATNLLDDVAKMMDFVNVVIITKVPELNSTMNKYPMFKIIRTNQDDFEQICVDYMNSVDKCQSI